MTQGAISQADLTTAQRLIDKHQALINQMEPGSELHRLAIELLLTYRDSLFLLQELVDLTHDPSRSKPSNRW